jgi:TP901 family phage tail tape measure protein
MAVQINVAANQAALMASIQAGVQAYNQRFANNNQINLNINARAFSQPLGRITGDVKDFEAALAASNARVIAFGASTAVLGGVIRSFKELAIATIEVEKNLTDINRVFGLTTSQLQKFSIELFNVSKTTATSFNEASKAALEFSRQGLKAEDTLQRTKDALTLTRLAGISTANAVDALTSTVNGFAQTGVTTTQILNKLVAVEQDYAVGAGDLAEALSRTGQAAQEAGVSLDQLNALVTAAQQSTARGGAVIGNALKTIFTRLQRTDTLDQLEAFNISVRDVQGNILPAVQILQNFAGAYKGLADAQRAQLSEQVAGVYQVNILKAIVNDLNKSQGVYAGALQRGASATNEAEIATAKLNKTLDALLSQTGIASQQLANNIGKVTFEPLAKYGAEQLKSFVEGMNEILEGEGIGSTFANGFLKGIRNIIAGPGAIAAFFTLFKLIQNSFSYLTQALPQIAGITTESQNRKNIEASILQILQQQGPIAQALVGATGNQAAQAQLLLQLARQQTAEYQQQTALAKNLATTLSAQGVAVKGGRGLQVTRAGGYIPSSTKMAEAVGAKAGGYSPGRVVKSPVGGVMNTAEDVKYVPGFAQPFINPPANSKAGRAHRQNAIARTGVDPYMYRGFIPNFAAAKLINVSEDEYKVIDGDTIKADATIQKLQSFRLSKIDAAESDQKYGDLATKVAKQKFPYAKDFSSSINVSGVAAYNRGVFDSDELVNSLIDKGYAVPDLRYVGNKDLLNRTLSAKRKKNNNGIWSEISNGQYIHPKAIQFINQLKTVDKNLYDNVFSYSAGRSFDEDIDIKKYDKKQKVKLYEAALSGRDKYNFAGFIPNFAVPLQTARIPWFKKYSSLYKNTSGDDDVFKIGDFPTYGRGLTHEYAKKGNANMLSYLHEDFVRSALNIALGSKQVIRPQDVGFKNKPISDISNSNDFDLLYRLADGSYSLLELKQDFKNISGSITGFMNAKLANAEKENPELVKKVRSMIAVSNMPKKFNPAIKNPADQNSEFEAAVASIVKDKYSNVEPTIREKLTKLTDGLLRRYEAKKNSYFKGFIPNLAGITGMTNVARAVPFTSSDVFPKDTDLLGTVWQKRGSFGPVPVTNEGELNGLMNNLIASTLGSNVFLPNEENSTTGIEHAAKILSSGGRTKKGRNSGVVGQLLGNEMMDINLDNVYKATVTGKKNKLSYASLHKVLPKWWSKTPETKDAWQFLYNAAKNGTRLDNTTIKSKTSVLRDAYNNFLKKYDYVLTELKLDPYLRQVEGMGNVNYGVLREDLKGVADISRLSEREKTLSLEQTTGQYRQNQYYAKQKYDLLAKSVLPIRPSELEFYKNDNALLQMLREYGLPYGVYKSNSKVLAGLGNWKFNTTDRKQHLSSQGFIPNFISPDKISEILSRIKSGTSGFSEEEQKVFLSKYGSEAPFTASKKQVLSSGMLMRRLIDKLGLNYIRGRSVDQLNKDAKSGYMSGALNFNVPENLTFTDAAGFIPNFNIGLPIEKGYAFNDGRIYNAMYHAEAWDDIEGSTKGAIKYAVHRGKLLLQTNAAISDKLKQEFLKRGISPSAFSPVDDVDRNMRSKNVEDIDNAMKKLGDIHQLSGGIKGIYNRRKNEYTGLIKNGQFVDLYSRGGLSQDELKLHGGSIDSWLDRYNKTFSSGALQLSWKPITEELISNLSQHSAFRNFAGGFIPNFAYKQAVMGLEESMSGNKAIFDTKPFPHIRNSSQPTFSSAIADHGGLSNALSDSMRGQKAAGLMNKGFVPNFGILPNNRNFDVVRFSNSIAKSVDDFSKQLSNKIISVKDDLLLGLDLMNKNFDPQKIQRTAESTAKKIISSISGTGNEFAETISSSGIDAINSIRNKFTRQNIAQSTGGGSSQRLTAAQMAASFGNLPTRNTGLEEFTKNLSKASTAISIAGPQIAGLIEQIAFGNKQRIEMTSNERVGQSLLSTGLTAVSTGAGIGASFGPQAALIGGAIGGLVGLTSAFKAATLTVEELQDVANKYKNETQQSVSAAQSYIDTLKTFQTSVDPEIIKKASTSLEQYFKNIEDVQLQKVFKETGNDVNKLATSLKDYEKRRTREQFRKEEVAKASSYTDADFKTLAKAGYSVGTFGKKAYLQTYNKPKEIAKEVLTDFSTFFNDLQESALDESGIKELQNIVLEEKYRSNLFGVVKFDQSKIVSFLKGKNVSSDITASLSEMFDSLENEGNQVGLYILENLVDLFTQSKNEVQKDEQTKKSIDQASNQFLIYRRNLIEKISEDFNAANDAIKLFESQSSLSQLLPAKLKEINDIIFNSILNNLTPVRSFALKETQARSTATLQSLESNRLRKRTLEERKLKQTETRTEFEKQVSDIIFSSPVIKGISSQESIDRFLQGGTNRSKSDLKNFAESLVGTNINDIDKLVDSLRKAQDAFKNTTNDIESQTKFKLQEIAYNDVINEMNAATTLKQIGLEREKQKIILSQKDAADTLKNSIEKAKISASERLELTKIETGGEFRYLGLNKRQEFEARQIDAKKIFDQEQDIAQNQAIADARRSIIEIAAQDANTKAQDANTNAIFDLIDAMATSFNMKGLSEVALGNEQIGLGYTQAAQDMRARNELAKNQYKASKESLRYSKLSNLGVDDDSTIDDTIRKLQEKMKDVTLTEDTRTSIKETITTLEISAKQIGSSATIFQARAAQSRKDFERSSGFVNNMNIGFRNLNHQADEMVDQLGRNLPSMFADGLVDGIKAAIRETDNLGEALMGIASKFLDEISTVMMRSAMYNILGNMGIQIPGVAMSGNQKGGYIRAQSGMYISGTGSGDKYPALLENGEYVLNRKAVMAMGGPAEIDKLNFSMAPRFASGGSFASEFTDLQSMEAGMTTAGLENSKLYGELRDIERQKQEQKRQKDRQRKQMIAGIVGSLAGAAVSFGLNKGIQNMKQNAALSGAKEMAESGTATIAGAGLQAYGDTPQMYAETGLSPSDVSNYNKYVKAGYITPTGGFTGGQSYSGFRSFFSAPKLPSSGKRQLGGLIGSRLSDTIPAYAEGGLYNSSIVRKYGVGLQGGGMGSSVNNSNVVNNNNASNSFNFNTNVNRDGTVEIGANSTSYKQQDVELSQNLNNRIYGAVLDVIKDQQRFGGSLAGTRRAT